jgi:PAS domain S-box-containing protein
MLGATGQDVTIESAHLSNVLDAASSGEYDAIVYKDSGGGDNGLALLNTLRSNNIPTPVIMSTSSAVDDRVQEAYKRDDHAYVETEAGVDSTALNRTLTSMISDRRRQQVPIGAAAAASVSPASYHAVVDSLPQGVMLMDRDGRIVYVNRSAIRLLRYSDPAELLGSPVLRLFPLAYNNVGMGDIRTLMHNHTAGRRSYRWKMVDRHGEHFYAHAVGFSIHVEERQLTAIILEKVDLKREVALLNEKGPSAAVRTEGEERISTLIVCDGLVMKSGLQLILSDEQDHYVYAQESDDVPTEIDAGGYDAMVYACSSFGEKQLQRLQKLVGQKGGLPVVLATLTGEQQYFNEAIAAGVHAIVHSETDFDGIPRVVQQVAHGAMWFSEEILKGAVRQMPIPGRRAEAPTGDIGTLTRREREVLSLLAQGMKNKKIADKLGLSYRTVVTHVYNIYRKLKISSRTEAIHFAIAHRLVDVEMG